MPGRCQVDDCRSLCRGHRSSQTVLVDDEPFPPVGPCDAVPHAQRYYDSFRLLVVRLAQLRFLRGAIPWLHPLARAGSEGAPPLLDCSRGPQPRLCQGNDKASQVPGESTRKHALLSDPDEAAQPRQSGLCDVAFHKSKRVGPRERYDLEAQSHGLLTRCLRFAAQVTLGPRKTRFRLAAALAGRTGYRETPMKVA